MDKKGAITNEIKVESQNINLWCHRKEYNKRWYNALVLIKYILKTPHGCNTNHDNIYLNMINWKPPTKTPH